MPLAWGIPRGRQTTTQRHPSVSTSNAELVSPDFARDAASTARQRRDRLGVYR